MRATSQMILLSFVLSLPLFASAMQYESGDVLYVWAQSGLNVRTMPSISAQKIGKLQAAERVEVISISSKGYDIKAVDVHPELFEDNIYHDEGSIEAFYLRGIWVKVKGASFEGYVVDSYLLKYKPPTSKSSIKTYFESLYGESLKVDTTWHRDCDGAGNVDCYSYEGCSKSGFGISGSYMMSATDQTIIIPEMGLEEGFVFCNYFFPLEDGLRQKKGVSMLKYMERTEEHLYFMEGDICEFSLSIANGNLYISEGCSC